MQQSIPTLSLTEKLQRLATFFGQKQSHPLRQQRWYAQPLLHLGLLTGVVLLAYAGMWRAYFATLDDFGITGWVRSQPNLWVAIQGYGSGVRFLNYIPIWFKAHWFGLDATPYLWVSLAQYLLVVWLFYLLARQVGQRCGYTNLYAFLAALFFAVAYVHYEVVTYVSASDYTFWAIVYLVAFLFFLHYLKWGRLWHYLSAVLLYGILAFAHDFTLSFPLVLLAAHGLLYLNWQHVIDDSWSERWRLLRRVVRLHLPFWVIWAVHVTLQLSFVMGGTSEAVYSVNGYAPGWHSVGNLRYLIFLWLPNATLGPVYGFLSTQLPLAVVDGIWQLSLFLGTLLHLILLWLFWKGGRLVRFAVAFLYLPFLQYTPWQGHFIEAPRYLLLPSVGSALLSAWVVLWLMQRSAIVAKPRYKSIVIGMVTLFLLANIAVLQIWIQRHVENGHFRRAFVTNLHDDYLTRLGPDALVWIEVPTAKYTDLADSCRLVFQNYYVPCITYVTGEPLPMSREDIPSEYDFYWLQATAEGIHQRYPPDAR